MTAETSDRVPARQVGTWRGTVSSFLTLLAGEGAARVLGLASVVVMARALGPHGFGPVVFATSMLAWFWLVVDNGTQIASTPDVARNPGLFAPTVERVLGLRIVLALGASVTLVLAAQLASNTETTAEVYALFAIVLPLAALNPRWMVLGVGRSRLLAVGNVAGQAAILVGVLALVHDDLDLTWVPIIVAAGELTYALVLIVGLAPRFGLLRPRVDLSLWGTTLRKGVPLMIGSASRGALFSFDLLVIAYALGPGSAGYYGAALKPVLFASTVAGLFAFSFLPAYSASTAGDALRLYRRAVRSAGVAALAVTLCLVAGAGLLVGLVFGDEFAPAATVLAILALRLPFMALSGVYSSVLIARDGQLALMRNNVAGGAVNVVGVLIGVALAGIEGAAVASVVSAVVILALNVRSATRLGLVPRPRAPRR